jgi:uncharacterized protein YxeA
MWKQILYETSLYGKGKIDETLANFMKQSTQQRRKRRNKDRGPNSKPEEQKPKWVRVRALGQIMFQSSHQSQEAYQKVGASGQIMFQSSHQTQEAYQKVGASEQIMFQSSHQLQEAYQKEGASHQNKSCSKTLTHHKKHIKKRKGWIE